MRINWKQILLKLSSINTSLTTQQQKRVLFKNEKGKETPLRAEFTGDKYPATGDPAKKEISTWKEQNAMDKTYRLKANPRNGDSLKEKNWRYLKDVLTNENAGRAETVKTHDELAKGSEPTYKTGAWKNMFNLNKNAVRYYHCPSCGFQGASQDFSPTNGFNIICPKCDTRFMPSEGDPTGTGSDFMVDESLEDRERRFSPRQPFGIHGGIHDMRPKSSTVGTKYRIGSKFASRVSKNIAVLQDMGTFAKFKERIAAKECIYVSPNGEASPTNENLIVVAYTRPERNDAAIILTPLGNFIASFEYKADYTVPPEKVEGEDGIKHNELEEKAKGYDDDANEAKKLTDSPSINDTDLCEVPEGSVAYAIGEDGEPKFFTAENIVQIVNEFRGDIGTPTKDNGELKKDDTSEDLSEPSEDNDDFDKGLHGESSWKTLAKSPPHSEYTVHELKKSKKVDNPFALAWWMKNRGMKLHDTKPKKSSWESVLMSVADYGSNYDATGLNIPYTPGNPEVQIGSRVLDRERGLHGTVLRVDGLVATVDWDELGYGDMRSTQKLEVISSKKTAAKKPYYCTTCDSGFSEGQMNFHKNHEYSKRGEEVEDEGSEEFKLRKEDEAHMKSKEAANIEFQRKTDGTVNISMEDTPPGTSDMVNGVPQPQPVVPPAGAQDQSQVQPAPEPAPVSTTKGKKASAALTYEDGYRNGHLDKVNGQPALNVALNSPNEDYTRGYNDGYKGLPSKSRGFWSVGSSVKDVNLGDGIIESISGEEVIASFSGRKYKTTLSALG